MNASLRRLTGAGLDRFGAYLIDLQADKSLAAPNSLLFDKAYSEQVQGGGTVEEVTLRTKNDAAVYLHRLLGGMKPDDIDRDVGLWSWLALYYFEQVCPVELGKRDPHKPPRYIFEPLNHQRRYRHVLWTPYWILRVMPDHNRIYLNESLTVHGDLVEQTLSRLVNVLRLQGFREVVDLLYFNEETGTYKRGTLSRKRRGSLWPRLVTRVRQLSLTYDVAAMDGPQIIEALGEEFSGWVGSHGA
jgi:hypothetical protein